MIPSASEEVGFWGAVKNLALETAKVYTKIPQKEVDEYLQRNGATPYFDFIMKHTSERLEKNNLLGLISGVVATICILSCKSDERHMMQIPSSSDTVYAIQHSNAIRLIDSVKIWKTGHPGEPYTFSVIDSFAQNSIFTGHDYHLPGSTFYFITYVKDDFFEVVYCPERRGNEINMPYFMATPDTVYVLKY